MTNHFIFFSMQVNLKERTFSESNMIFFTFNSQQYFKYFDFSKTSSLTLTFDHVICISIRVIYSLGVSIVPSLETFKQRGWVKRYWMDIIYTKTSRLTLTFDHVTWNLLSRSIHYTKFENFQAKGSKYIEQTSLGPQTKWETFYH